MFENIIGQNRAINILSNAIKADKIAQAYIFYGPDGSGKLLTALTFAKIVNCIDDKKKYSDSSSTCQCSSCNKITQHLHPDVRLFFPIPNFNLNEYGYVKVKERKEETIKDPDWISYNEYIKAKINQPWKDYEFDKATAIRIEQIRALQQDILMSKHEGKKKVYIIENFDTLTHQASNAFLKTLEEPPLDTHFILIVRNIDKILPTILSRCISIKFSILHSSIIHDYMIKNFAWSEEKASYYAPMVNGSIEKAINLYHTENIQLMELSNELINIIKDKDDLAFISWVEKHFVKGSKKTDLLRNLLQYLCFWVRDTHVNNVLQNNEKHDNTHYINIIIELNELLEKQIGNVNQKLILSQIYYLFNKELA